jgi:transposase-like protein
VNNEYVWLSVVAIEPIDRIIPGIRMSVERRSMLVAERFIHELLTKYGKRKQSVSTDGWR